MDNKHIIGEVEFLSKEVKARKYRGKIQPGDHGLMRDGVRMEELLEIHWEKFNAAWEKLQTEGFSL